MMPPTLHCMNCGASTLAGQGKVFAQVFVCPTCFAIAENFYERSEKELKYLLTIIKESLRVALVHGMVKLSEGKLKDISKKELLEEIVKMDAARGKNVG